MQKEQTDNFWALFFYDFWHVYRKNKTTPLDHAAPLLFFFFLQQTCDVTGCVLTLYWRKDKSSLTFNQFIAPVEVKDETHQCFNTPPGQGLETVQDSAFPLRKSINDLWMVPSVQMFDYFGPSENRNLEKLYIMCSVAGNNIRNLDRWSQ